ncbi:PREDICTED: uncharacterized protein KIAA1522 homolog isoform X2 [Cyprinodon variegatus]|uniref:KIAA1522 ortholog n=1 Tax=Cyprinodon variegatus TaxID=28743 RepID=A0A3Q2E9I2_CYPVA|nr:PREDICTED: uncharacterized protein KIAA1522 homolog isoform X2 [Cyprinodon variegatus]
MSRRRSTGDLVPRDITEILAREARAQRGQRKSGSSLGQAFSWLRKSRRKKNLGNGLNRVPTGGTDNNLALHNQEAAKAGPKGNESQKRLTVHYTASQHYQENVFIEGSRSQYLEDLHTEAQEGLKIQQQEEHKNGINYADNESIAFTDTICPEQDTSCKDRGDSMETSPNSNNDTTATSAVLDRPGLTHQGSTFKPLNPMKRHERGRKRNRRTTIMGIPNQVQKELALNRSSTFQPLPTQLPSHETPDGKIQPSVVIIPTMDGGTPFGKKEGARVHLSELEVFRDEQASTKQLYAVYQNEEMHICPTSTMRPKSLAVPTMTTSFSLSPSTFNFLQEPQGPVMSISPQATYLSTIIPNAVLPASVEVIEIDRSNSRTRGSSVNHGTSVCAVSKSSLTSEESAVSPTLSRRMNGDGSQTNSSNYDSALMSRSASGSNWSESQSSKTIISDSTVPSSDRAGCILQQKQIEESCNGQDLTSLCNSGNANSSLNKVEANTPEIESGHGATQSLAAGDQTKSKRNCIHSLSVTKTKQPPAPPRRTNSLHGKKIKSEFKVLAEFEHLSNSSSVEGKGSSEKTETGDEIKSVPINPHLSQKPLTNSDGESLTISSSMPLTPSEDSSSQPEEAPALQKESDLSSSQKTTSDGGKFERTISPSSGYSSQSGTPTLSPKEISPDSSDEQKKKPIKPERSASRASSSTASPSSSLTSLSSGTSEPTNADVTTCSSTLPPQDSSPTKEVPPSSKSKSLRAEVQELFNIPPPPKVKAPPPPPPETWAHSRRTVDLLCRSSHNLSKTPFKPVQIKDCRENQVEPQREPGADAAVTADNQSTQKNPIIEISGHVENLGIKDPEDGGSELNAGECSDKKKEQKNEKDDTVAKTRESSSICVLKKPDSQETTSKKEPPPVMKKPIRMLLRDETEQPLEPQERKLSCSTAIDICLSVEDHTTKSQNAEMVPGDKSDLKTSDVPSMQRLTVDVSKLSKLSPPHTPPPAYQPTPPPLRKEHDMSNAVDSCWPPPPPPLEGEVVFDGGDELDFPPPPPLIRDDVTDLIEQTPTISFLPLVDNKPVDDEQVVKADPSTESSSQDTPCAKDTVSLSSVELLPVPAVTRAESPVSVQTAVPSSSSMKRNSLKLEDQPPSSIPDSPQLSTPTSVPKAPPLPMENVTPGVNFRRQPSGACRDSRSKELLSRHKSAPIPKEDANIPLVTPSLLQMVRLRTVSATEDQPQPEDATHEGTEVLENSAPSQGSQNIPPKPIRKSLSVKSPPQIVKISSVTMSSPSVRLQEAIRMKTAAMSSRDCLPHRLGMKSPSSGCIGEPGVQSLKTLEGCDMLKSPASTASFIFSRSTKRVIIEPVTPSSSEAQESLKQSLAAELKQVSEQSKAGALSNGRVRSDRIPPPIAKKPSPGSTSPMLISQSCLAKTEVRVEEDTAPGAAQPVAPPKTTTRVTADTIETLF